MPDIQKLLADLRHAFDALASALDDSPHERVQREQTTDDRKLLDIIARMPDSPWRSQRAVFGGAQRADAARARLRRAGRLRNEIRQYTDSLNRRQTRTVLAIADVMTEREKAPEGAPVPRRILPPGF